MRYCMSTYCIDPESIRNKIEYISNAGFDSIELWIKDIQDVNYVNKLLKDFNLFPAQTTKIEGWFELDGTLMGVGNNEQEILDECKRRIEITAQLNCPYIVANPSRNDRGFYRSLEAGAETYNKLLEIGKNFNVCPTVEFIGQSTQVNNIQNVLNFLNIVNNDYAKIIVDAFHIWRSGDEMDDFLNIPINKVSLLHISDASDSYKKNNYKDRHRIMPGDGVINLKRFFEIAFEKQFQGDVSLGVYNRDNWDKNALDVAKEGYVKMKKIIEEINV